MRHPTPITYLLTYAALMALSALTVGLSFLPLGPWGPPLALAIAAAKGVLIALFFMHLVEQRIVNALALAAALLLVLFFVSLAALDIPTRGGSGVAARPAATSALTFPTR